MATREAITIGGETFAPGGSGRVDLPVGELYTHEPFYMPVHVVHGKRDGPVLFASAAVHGDELNGIEIIRRILALPMLRRMRGTLLAVPIVNVLGVFQQSRYLPDRRDLNRSFPGSAKGSLAARLAHLFVTEIVKHSSHGIDLHTGAVHRSNLPQIRANLEDKETMKLARAFGAPVAMHSALRPGSLRGAAGSLGIPMLLYEAGEALRFDEVSIRVGVKGMVSVMRELGMLPPRRRTQTAPPKPFIAHSSSWIRAPGSGIFRANVTLGARVEKGQEMGSVGDPFSENAELIRAAFGGIVIGRTNLPLVHEGEALFHVGRFEKPKAAARQANAVQSTDYLEDDPLFEDDAPIV